MEMDNEKDSTIELLGAVGLFSTIGCAIQAVVMINAPWLMIVTLGVYGTLFTSYLLFFKMKPLSVILLLISSILLFLLQVLFLLTGAILWLSVALCLFTLVVVVMIYVQELQHYIKCVDLYHKTPIA